jgi:hypothetical protein
LYRDIERRAGTDHLIDLCSSTNLNYEIKETKDGARKSEVTNEIVSATGFGLRTKLFVHGRASSFLSKATFLLICEYESCGIATLCIKLGGGQI